MMCLDHEKAFAICILNRCVTIGNVAMLRTISFLPLLATLSGIMMLEANSTPEEAPHVLKLLRAELNSLLEDGVYEDELRRAKDKWISSLVLSSESTFARMRSLSNDWVTEGRLLSVDEEVERIEKVTAEDVMRSLRRFPMRDKQDLTTLAQLSEKALLT